MILNIDSRYVIVNYTKENADCWLEKMRALLDKVKTKVEDKICKSYKKDMSPQEALGRINAQEIISKYIASGEILEIIEEKRLEKLSGYSIKSIKKLNVIKVQEVQKVGQVG